MVFKQTVATVGSYFLLRANMSVDATRLLFEGFLQKRKDNLKLRWVRYWFRLQNTTLFFYTEKNGSATHLRGYYYIFTVQSVREVQRAGTKRFMFEMIMKDGKKKVLAADTPALRKEWVQYLWQAMHLSTSGVSDSRGTHLEVCEQRDRLKSNNPISSYSDSVMELLPARPLSAPGPSLDQIHLRAESVASPVCQPEEMSNEEATYMNTLLAYDSLDDPRWPGGFKDRQEGDYDVLPPRNKICEVNHSAEMEEGVYDFPLSYRRSAEHQDPTDSIYDVPSCLLRKMSDHSTE
ncbi:uncharacterized protein [Brachyistius frenatus]|uniref:uncharacterized protein isoform X2 n=1 Tax=Brachyistius frenatus TaxID=100188 RepID=UPI0037E7DB44